ncbi:hypothetical protein [Segetibacter koreensis]|uniref:hypothetical protein n=1 Tax=Segetibacter koreensis TaxID=398037 RepID=UPI00035FCAAC|nr:hypothetical protein [Segetibacter koreensis]
MKEQLQHLHNLLETLTSSTSSKSFSELNRILEKYTKILDFVNSYNDSYKRATSVYYTDINSIRDNIQESLYAEAQKAKDTAFENARNELQRDIQALAILIRPEEELAEISA